MHASFILTDTQNDTGGAYRFLRSFAFAVLALLRRSKILHRAPTLFSEA
jgi:hypothetical protein